MNIHIHESNLCTLLGKNTLCFHCLNIKSIDIFITKKYNNKLCSLCFLSNVNRVFINNARAVYFFACSPKIMGCTH